MVTFSSKEGQEIQSLDADRIFSSAKKKKVRVDIQGQLCLILYLSPREENEPQEQS